MKTQLDKDQIQNLLKLGIGRCWASDKGWDLDELGFGNVVEYPVFKLEDIIRILPKDFDDDRYLNIENWRNSHWYAGYCETGSDDEYIIGFEAKELIDVLYKLLVKSIEKGWVEEHFFEIGYDGTLDDEE